MKKKVNPIHDVEKEDILALQFPQEDVFKSSMLKKVRWATLKNIVRHGNVKGVKVKMIFRDDMGLKQVKGIIWGMTDKMVILKKSKPIALPLNRILAIT